MVQKSESTEERSQIAEVLKDRECVFRVEIQRLKFSMPALQGASMLLYACIGACTHFIACNCRQLFMLLVLLHGTRFMICCNRCTGSCFVALCGATAKLVSCAVLESFEMQVRSACISRMQQYLDKNRELLRKGMVPRCTLFIVS